jgi:predicted RNA-binding Zn-ribbon protein involved in translation (DUF1610 family)
VKVRLPAGEARAPRKAAAKPRETILCPQCGSYRLVAHLGFMDGARYRCKDCGFVGALVVTGMAPAGAPPEAPKEGPP